MDHLPYQDWCTDHLLCIKEDPSGQEDLSKLILPYSIQATWPHLLLKISSSTLMISLRFRSTPEESPSTTSTTSSKLTSQRKPNPSRRHHSSLSAALVSTRPSHPFHRLPRLAPPNLEHKSPPSSPSAFL